MTYLTYVVLCSGSLVTLYKEAFTEKGALEPFEILDAVFICDVSLHQYGRMDP
jgi:hypothetical protein